MAIRTFNLPDPGEGLVEAEIVEWRVNVGDTVKVNDMVLEVETAKSLVELPIPWAGTVTEVLVEVGQTVDVGTPLIRIDDGTGGDEAPAAPAAEGAAGEEKQDAILVGYGAKAGATARRPRKKADGMTLSSVPAEMTSPSGGAQTETEQIAETPAVPEQTVPEPRVESPAPPAPTAATARAGERPKAKPPVRKLAKDLGVDLTQVRPTGADGIITRDDVQAHASGGSAQTVAAPAGAEANGAATAGSAAYGTAFGSGEREVRIPIKGVRKMTAQAMVGSAFSAPHVTEWITVDVTRTVELVERLKVDREFRDVKVTPLLVLAKAMILAIRRNPGVNATWDEQAQEIVQKNYVNLGIAAATPRGLVVPNIKDAHAMTMRELADAIAALTATARDGRTQPAEMSQGTITITNVGVFGVDSGTPIINPGESAILAFGTIRKQPWVVTGADGSDEIAIRHVTQLALSFDHRLIDGELGSRFLADVAAIMEDPSRALVWA
ncbi:branched-chain alpha-keto acid dehydrogenase subunit E2 [Intrasporangium chromatireducens Q5-1]|uniref:Dihydrolipoamide acetyltransferase component of pyruvate dehydrogenase complex n=1 Tax=Intrasporangium chromatireducens Q5-1 TaxID=584657 RepID=W9GM26_9MICO|nr:dihydrolipoamide acetyltransferase family protein [Intrasporangium chromatireducens]EWT04944.1 branched-chain alpha-keto acid dehydrogenase subunit E2 [Intrasporangium chromatireducens Q5-1]